ncbi:MAG: 23S rRNA pseudouridine955/2504/2580 synthase [Oleiphilaceae bacterium]|jgi:23S rRNA pseudouridine955/2504/2580 synthase
MSVKKPQKNRKNRSRTAAVKSAGSGRGSNRKFDPSIVQSKGVDDKKRAGNIITEQRTISNDDIKVVAESTESAKVPPQVKFVTVTEKNETQRVDNFLITQLKGVPKSKIYKIIRKGEVRINKKRCKPETKLVLADIVRIPPVFGLAEASETPKVSKSLTSYLDTAVIFEDKWLLVINKPSGLAVHGGSGIHLGLIEALRTRYPETQFLELVHRLDRDTSGCILIAKSRSALRNLHEQFRNGEVNKIYHLAVYGSWPKHRKFVDVPLKRSEMQSGERVVLVHQDGKPSQTRFKTLNSSEHFSLMEAKPLTGRTHQIRVHALFSGCPLVGDVKYLARDKEDFHGMEKSRLMLHAKEIHFTHPKSDEAVGFEAPYDDMFNVSLKMMSLNK